MKKIIAGVLLFLGLAATSAWALDVPRSDNAKPSDKATNGLTTASTASSTADEHVPT